MDTTLSTLIIGGGGCIVKNFADYDKERVIIIDDICATAKGFEYNGKVNCIIVKDLSRFGREYVEAGDYLERIFPLLGIRFIAINDNYDNKVNPFNITVPIKNIINTLYARYLSKKSAAALRIKQANGEFIGAYASYGYKKSPEDKHKLIIDEETAPVVK